MKIFTIKNNNSMAKQHEDDHESSGLVLIDKPTCYVPRFFDDLMEDIDNTKEAGQVDEFSIFCESKIEGFKITLKAPYYFIPKQVVHSGEVDYFEPRPNDKINTVIHRHPDSLPTTFSAGDNEYINKNFDISLLWTRKEGFTFAQYNFYQKRQRLAIRCELTLTRPINKIQDIKKIKKYVAPVTKMGYEITEDKESHTSALQNWQNGKANKNNESATTGSAITNPNTYNFYKDYEWNGAMWVKKNIDKEMSGSSIIDNDGNLIGYDDAISAQSEDWVIEALVFLGELNQDPQVNNKAGDLTDLLDHEEAGYIQLHPQEALRFNNYMKIVCHAGAYWSWEEQWFDSYAGRFAPLWVNENYKELDMRTHRIYKHILMAEKVLV